MAGIRMAVRQRRCARESEPSSPTLISSRLRSSRSLSEQMSRRRKRPRRDDSFRVFTDNLHNLRLSEKKWIKQFSHAPHPSERVKESLNTSSQRKLAPHAQDNKVILVFTLQSPLITTSTLLVELGGGCSVSSK
eukprot:759379-Hanusia_phi.AAC.2